MTTTMPRIPGAPFDEALLEHIDHHVESEQELLDSYADLALRSPEHVRYLIGLIVDDEERHHRILQEMANRLLTEIDYREVEPSVPYVGYQGIDRDRLVEDTERFLALEREDLKGMRDLGRTLRQQRRGGLFPLLVHLLELDTKKHIAILEFIEKSTRTPY